ncbi:GtrA family protein [Halosegnis sp.]|uniref:GtrA family protein n=1 Tax=Halosegnis sp. TaxID=2864959 RepID=UPI0035D4131A
MSVGDLLRDRLRALARADRVGQFVSVGVAGATLETAVVFVLTGLLTVGPLPAKAVGAEASITLMFLLNDRWTFASEGATGLWSGLRRYLKSHIVRLAGLSIAFITLYALTSLTPIRLVVFGADVWPTVANAIGIGVGMTLNYVAESLLTWRVARE